MRKFSIAPRAVILISLLVAGCGSSTSASNSSPAPSTSATPPPLPASPLPAPISLVFSTGLDPRQPAGSLKVVMTNLTFFPGDVTSSTPDAISVGAGRASFFLVNPTESSAEHNMSIKDSLGRILARSVHVPVGNSGVFVIENLPAGHYTMYCEVDGHAKEGMTGDLTAS